MRISIRQRLTAWYAAALLLGLGIFALGMWVSLQERLIAGVDARLSQRMKGLETALGPEAKIRDRLQLQQELAEYVGEVSDGSLVQLRETSGVLVLPSPKQPALPPPSAGQTAPYTAGIEGRQWRIATSRIQSAGSIYEAQIAVSLDEIFGVMRDFRHLLLWMVPGVLIVACLGGYWLSSRALRPVDEITTVARSIGVQNLSQRIAVPQTGDELQRMAQTWNDVLERLDVAVKRIRQFTSDASHELRTPLALIRATAELALRRERDPEGYRTSLRQIENEAEHMTVLTESLLTLARADADGLGMTMRSTNLNELIDSVVQQNAALALDRGVMLRAVTAEQPVVATADVSRVRRILLILVDNALKHTPAGGTVTVSAAAAAGSSTLAVEDTAEGIPTAALPHIFERFYRADPARGSGSGFGLGLSIAQAIAQAHGSAIAVSSTPGAGARFFLQLKP
jgi:two-component system, OmpR family, heavy metal sensor histidine kinase CusS